MMAYRKGRLATGQTWQTRAAAIEILRLGKRRIHYRITKHLGHRHVSSQISPITAMENYLRVNDARLVAESSVN